MITRSLLDQFLDTVSGQPLQEGTRYAREARVHHFEGDAHKLGTVVDGPSGAYRVTFRLEDGTLEHSCDCPSWRVPCKHEVAAVLVLRQGMPPDWPESGNARAIEVKPLEKDPPRFDEGRPMPRLLEEEDPAEAEQRALEERQAAARRESLALRWGRPPVLEVTSPSGFTYHVQVRGDADGPHSCDCPDFEANRLHTCKHVERVRRYLRRARTRLAPECRSAVDRPRVYLHFGQTVEPRLFGTPRGHWAPEIRRQFHPDGRPRRRFYEDWRAMRRWLDRFERRVEPEAMAWLDRRLSWIPSLSKKPFAEMVPALPLDPYDYQWEGAEFLARRGRALLADEMGLGKTVQAILAATALRRARREPVQRVTVVCPASLRGGWQEEIRRWIGEEALLLEGPARRRAGIIAEGAPWLITHYEQVLRDHRHHASHAPDLLIIDEAQRAKGLQARTARVLKAIDARYVFALTGTPLENRLEEAYAIAQLVDQRLLPPLWQVERDHFVRAEGRRQVVLYRNLGAIRSSLGPTFLRRRKEDVALQLPERVRTLSHVPMHPAVEDTYEETIASVARLATKKPFLPADFDRMMRLLVVARRCCNGPHMLGMDAEDRKVPKLAELEQLLQELCLGEGRKAVVFSEWTDMTDRVEALCRRMDLRVHHLHGGVPVRKRPLMIQTFTEEDGPAVFVSTDAGGVGLNLQAADVLINLDMPWNPARLEQRIGRIHRIGSRGTVQVILLVCKGCIEDRIRLLHATKENVFQNVFADDGDDVIEAPGGSGKFRDMVQALLQTEMPVLDDDDAVDAVAGAAEPEGVATNDADGNGRASHGKTPAQSGDREMPGVTPAVAPDVPPVVSPSGTSPAVPPDVARVAACAPPAEPTTASVDPASVAAAVAAVAPTLPAEHRRSLATVFRALAEALEG